MTSYPSCLTPKGFLYGIHKPSYTVDNLRAKDGGAVLGMDLDGWPISNKANYPKEDLVVEEADWVYEIANPFFFRGATYISKAWADACHQDLDRIRLPAKEPVSFHETLLKENCPATLIEKLPGPLKLALATSSTDFRDLVQLAHLSCDFIEKENELGLVYKREKDQRLRPVIHDHDLFEAVANSPYLPARYQIAMVVRPGAQGASEIIGEWQENKTHVYEYLRRNSYIAGGHYAANMAEDALRYSLDLLSEDDINGLRHLYYQRSFVRIASKLGIKVTKSKGPFTPQSLESLRLKILQQLKRTDCGLSTLWGWNLGFDFAPSRYRLNASHQQIHQQYAMIPQEISAYHEGFSNVQGSLSSFSYGDLVEKAILHYRQQYDSDFFTDYLAAMAKNRRMDGGDGPTSLSVWSDERVMLFVPKAQTSQWELQLMVLPDQQGRFSGNIVQCDIATRQSLDQGILKAQQALKGLGARLVTSIELSKRIHDNDDCNQPLIYSFLPRLPHSPGAFSESQLRFINGHYPEDFAAACRKALGDTMGEK